MKEQDLEIIKSRTLFLKEGDKSSEIILVDPCNGDMYFTFELKYIEDIVSAKTKLSIKDEHHAELVIDTTPNGITKPENVIELGTYGAENRPLYIGFVIQPQIANSSEHNVIITFYTRKEVKDGIEEN